MDLREIEKIVKDTKGGFVEKKQSLISSLHRDDDDDDDAKPTKPSSSSSIDSGSTLQHFLDHIPISSIPGIHNSLSVFCYSYFPPSIGTQNPGFLELCNSSDVREQHIWCSPIKDNIEFDPTIIKHSNPYVGIIDFASMVLWFLEESENHLRNKKDYDGKAKFPSGIFSMLEHIPHIAQTKIGELAKSYLWHPFFPVNLDDTLFHFLLLLSKHQLHLVPVMEGHNSKVTGFVTQSAVLHLILQSSGLEWFDSTVDKPLSDFMWFENDKRAVLVYEDQSIAEAVSILWENRVCAIAVVQRETEGVIGCVRTSDVYHLLDNEHLFNNRKTATVGQFIRLETSTAASDPTIDRNLGALLSAGSLTLGNKFRPRMDSPVTNKNTDTLKQAMKRLALTKSNFSLLDDESQREGGLLTLRDIIIKFAPPCMDSMITGGRFFEAVLEQTGCDIRDGTMVCEGRSGCS